MSLHRGSFRRALGPVYWCKSSLSETCSSTTLTSTVRLRSTKARHVTKLQRESLPIDLAFGYGVCSARTSSAAGPDHEGDRMENGIIEDLEMGPIDYLVIEWPGRQPTGEAMPHLVDLVDRGLIRLLDLAFLAKAEDGSVTRVEIADLGEEAQEFAVFVGVDSGLLSDEDTDEAAAALEPGTSAALLVYENCWAAPFATAVRRGGGQLVASGRIPIQAVISALEAVEAA